MSYEAAMETTARINKMTALRIDIETEGKIIL